MPPALTISNNKHVQAAAASSSQGSNRRRRQQPPCNYTLLSADPQGVQWGQEDSEKGVLAPVGHAACRVRLFEGAEVRGDGWMDVD